MACRRPAPLAVLATLAALFAGAVGVLPARLAPADATSSLPRRLAERVERARVRPGRIGVSVVSLDTAQSVYEVDAALPLVPASVAKLATAAAALDLLGPGWRYETSIDARGDVDAATGTLSGDLVVHGSGDPNLSRRLHDGEFLHPLRVLAEGVARAGIRRVTGALVLDDGPFDREGLHPSWSRSDLDDWYGAPVGGLSFNDNCVTVVVTGGGFVGGPAVVEAPATSGPWRLVGSVETAAGRRTEVGGMWLEGRTQLRVAGVIPPRAKYDFDTPVPDPLAFFGGALLQALRGQGVAVEGGAKPAATREDRARGRPLASVSHGLAETLRVMDRRSQNFYASLVFKACGALREGSGSWASGERAVLDALARRRVADAGLRVVDGSGLSRENRLSAGSLARLLASLDRDALRGPILRDSLAVPGEDGTLEKRFQDSSSRGRVHAKTGTLGRTGVHALAGYVDGRSGAASSAPSRGFAFAILLNASPADGDPRDLIDDLVREIARE